MAIKTLEFPALSTQDKNSIKDLKVLIISTLWNADIVSSLVNGAQESLLDCGVEMSHISHIQVPGSWELVMATKLAVDEYDVIIPIGVLIKGSTMHFEYISEAVSKGLMDLCIQSKTPILYGVLNCLTIDQAKERAGLTQKGVNHGKDWGAGAVRMALLKKKLN